jgi:signal transduction histidine kinase
VFSTPHRDGKLQGVFAAARDVTERKRFEHTLQEKNLELENANMAKDRFLASMSHELRTPLNAIIGFTGAILMKLAGPLTADQERQLETIESSGTHLLSLINDLLDLVKIESGKLQVNREVVDCQQVLDEVATSLRGMAEGKGLEFGMSGTGTELSVRTDRRALVQVLLNLANNAIKFTETGRISLRLERRRDNGNLLTEFSVADSGTGITPEEQDKLFQAFQQVGTSGMCRREGTGLELYLSQKLAALIGGHIEFQSEFGKGSTFRLILAEHA